MAGTGGTESLEDIIAYSHNVGAAEVGMAVGPATLYKTIRAFGFGDSTKIEAPGENPGIVPALADWSGSTLPTVSFGHGISTTPLAMIRAYAAIANGGLLMRPRLLRTLYDDGGKTVYSYGPEIERRVMSEETAATLRRYLRAAVVRGTGNPTAQVAGYTTAGKTGTAQVVENGRYEPGSYIASFIGYVPAESPRYAILVKIEKPRGAYYGSLVAAPVFAAIARSLMLHADVMPSLPPRKQRPKAKP
jgi:cell division protein FtsI/penicillin-binding protein 2